MVINPYVSVTAGGTTNFTMTEVGYVAYADPAAATITATTVGAIMVATLSARDGIAHASHTLSDDTGGAAWTKVIGHDQELANADARHTVSVWWREVVSGDTSGTFTLTGDNGGTGSKGMTCVQIVPDASMTWVYEDGVFADSGTADWTGLSSGNTPSLSGSDLLLIAIASGRNGSTGFPTTISFTNINDQQVANLGGVNAVGQALSIESAGQAGGVKETTITFNSSINTEGAVGIVAFSG
jgi:hypothetical protein